MLRNLYTTSYNQSIIKEGGVDVVDKAKLLTLLTNEIANWFTKFTDATNIWYKKTSKNRLILIGILLAVVMNVDSIRLAKYYFKNPEVNKALKTYFAANQEKLENLTSELKQGQFQAYGSQRK